MELIESKPQHGTYYRVKDFVYLEENTTRPFRIGQIVSFKSGPNSTVFVKCRFYDRPRDVESHWIKKLNAISEKFMYSHDFHTRNYSSNATQDEKQTQFHQFKLRELISNKNGASEVDEGFVHASLIRGKCRINRFIEVESIQDYINKEDIFYYLACFEDQPKHLAPEGDIFPTKSERLSKIAHVNDYVPLTNDQKTKYGKQEHDVIVWDGPKCSLSEQEIEKFMAFVRSVGLYGRALDQTRRTSDCSIQSNLAYAFRDSTKYLSYHLLHSNNYNCHQAILSLFVSNSPIICTDQLELWTEEDIFYFYEEIKKMKRFNDILKKNPTWKSVKEMIEFYYMNKVTETYLTSKKERISKKMNGITQIFIPHSDQPYNSAHASTKPPNEFCHCQGCKTRESKYWYSWIASKSYYLCVSCWAYWKKYGGLKYPHKEDGLKIYDSVYRCSLCCIAFTNKRRHNRHMSNHYAHSCDVDNCHQKFSSQDEIELHKKYLHQYFDKIPDCPNQSRIFLYSSSPKWKSLRREYCKYALYTKPLCRRRGFPFDKNMLSYEGHIPVITSKKQHSRIGDLSQKFRKRSSNRSNSSQNGEPPLKMVSAT